MHLPEIIHVLAILLSTLDVSLSKDSIRLAISAIFWIVEVTINNSFKKQYKTELQALTFRSYLTW